MQPLVNARTEYIWYFTKKKFYLVLKMVWLKLFLYLAHCIFITNNLCNIFRTKWCLLHVFPSQIFYFTSTWRRIIHEVTILWKLSSENRHVVYKYTIKFLFCRFMIRISHLKVILRNIGYRLHKISRYKLGVCKMIRLCIFKFRSL